MKSVLWILFSVITLGGLNRSVMSEEMDSVYLGSTEGTATSSNVIMDNSSGQAIGVSETSTLNSSGEVTQDTLSSAGSTPNKPPVLSYRAVGPTITKTWFQASCGAWDPDDAPASLTYLWQYSGTAPTGASIDCNTCPDTIFRYTSQSTGTRIDVQCHVTDPHGLTTWDIGSASAFIP